MKSKLIRNLKLKLIELLKDDGVFAASINTELERYAGHYSKAVVNVGPDRAKQLEIVDGKVVEVPQVQSQIYVLVSEHVYAPANKAVRVIKLYENTATGRFHVVAGNYLTPKESTREDFTFSKWDTGTTYGSIAEAYRDAEAHGFAFSKTQELRAKKLNVTLTDKNLRTGAFSLGTSGKKHIAV